MISLIATKSMKTNKLEKWHREPLEGISRILDIHFHETAEKNLFTIFYNDSSKKLLSCILKFQALHYRFFYGHAQSAYRAQLLSCNKDFTLDEGALFRINYSSYLALIKKEAAGCLDYDTLEHGCLLGEKVIIDFVTNDPLTLFEKIEDQQIT